MRRSSLSLLVLLLLGPLCAAMPASRPLLPLRQRASAWRAVKPLPDLLPESLAAKKEAHLEVTPTTEVKVDGRPCRYKDVPADVEAVLIEVADDGKTILKIHFRARKR